MPPVTRNRIVDFIPGEYFNGAKNGTEPLTAIVAHVNSPSNVNLLVIDSIGVAHSQTSVPFYEDHPEPGLANYATWPEHLRRQAQAFERFNQTRAANTAPPEAAEAVTDAPTENPPQAADSTATANAEAPASAPAADPSSSEPKPVAAG